MPHPEASDTQESLHSILDLIDQAKVSALGDAAALRRAQTSNSQLLRQLHSSAAVPQVWPGRRLLSAMA